MTESSWQLRDTLSGVAGAVCLTIAGCPFDVVKIRLQIGGRGTLRTVLSDLLRQEGVLSLWRGAGPALSSALVENAVVFTANRSLTRLLADGRGAHELSFGQHALLGGASGCFSATAICAPEVVKCQLQAQRALSNGSGPPPTSYSVVTSILARQGVSGLFAGLLPLLMRDVPFNTLFFGSYRVFTAGATWAAGEEVGSPVTASRAFVCGGLAGVAAWSVVYPADTLKSRMQTHGAGAGALGCGGGVSTVGTLRAVLTEGGVRALYRGYSAAVCRAFPANAALFFGVETADAAMREVGM